MGGLDIIPFSFRPSADLGAFLSRGSENRSSGTVPGCGNNPETVTVAVYSHLTQIGKMSSWRPTVSRQPCELVTGRQLEERQVTGPQNRDLGGVGFPNSTHLQNSRLTNFASILHKPGNSDLEMYAWRLCFVGGVQQALHEIVGLQLLAWPI